MDIFQEVSEIAEKGISAAWCVIVSTSGSVPRHAGTKMIVYADGRTSGSVGGGDKESYVVAQAMEAIQEGTPRMVNYPPDLSQDADIYVGRLEVYVEPIIPQPTVLVVGLGHVGRAVARLAKFLEYRVVVSDDREGFAIPDLIPEADIYHTGKIPDLLEEMTIHKQTYIVLTTRSVDVDMEIFPAILDSPAAYIGVIGSKRRWEVAKTQLLEKGIKEKTLKDVVSPMGLDLEAETPEEIALSILAEIVMLRHGGKGGRMVDMKKYRQKGKK